MILTAIDTSAAASAAVVEDDTVLAERTEYRARRHAELLGPALSELRAATPKPHGVVVGIGPGPFTGLRAGIAAGIGYAIGLDVPVYGLPSHLAIALRYFESQPAPGPVVVATDARRREVYATVFAGLDDAGIPVVSAGPLVAAPAELAAQLSGQTRLGRGFDIHANTLGEPASTEPALLEPTAADLGRVAVRMLAAGREFPPLAPLYLREPDAAPLPGQPR